MITLVQSKKKSVVREFDLEEADGVPCGFDSPATEKGAK